MINTHPKILFSIVVTPYRIGDFHDLLFPGQHYRKRCALPRLAVQLKLPAHRLDKAIGDTQPQTHVGP